MTPRSAARFAVSLVVVAAAVVVAASRAAPAGATPSGADDAPKVSLAVAAAPGKPVRFVDRVEVAVESGAMGAPTKTGTTTASELSVEIAERAADGTFRAVLRVGQVVGKVSNPLLGDFVVDSSKPLPEDDVERERALGIVALSGTELHATLDAGGALTAVAGLDDARRAATKRWSVPAELAPVLADAVSEDSVRRAFGRVLAAAPLPAGESAVGRTWDHDESVPAPSQGVAMTVKTKLALAAVGKDDVTVTGKGTVALSGRRAEGAAVEKDAATSEVRLSRADGLPVSVKTTATVAATLKSNRGPAPLAVTVTSSLTRVERWPSAK